LLNALPYAPDRERWANAFAGRSSQHNIGNDQTYFHHEQRPRQSLPGGQRAIAAGRIIVVPVSRLVLLLLKTGRASSRWVRLVERIISDN
jgi:hypothetical protein